MTKFPNAPNSGMTFHYEVERRRNSSLTHAWFLRGEQGAVHIWATVAPDRSYYGHYHYGGIEMHFKSPPKYMEDHKPSHEHCWVLNGPCWHDGSSLQFEENVAPLLPETDLMTSLDHSMILETLISWYKSHLGELK